MVVPVPLNPPSLPVNIPSQTQKAVPGNCQHLLGNNPAKNSPDINTPVAFSKSKEKLTTVSSKVELNRVNPKSNQVAQFYQDNSSGGSGGAYVGPAISFGGGNTLYGAVSNFPMGSNLSLRPSAMFGNGITKISVPVTYSLNVGAPEPFESNPLFSPYVGGGLEYNSKNGEGKVNALGVLGAAVNLSEGNAIVGEVSTNFNDPVAFTVGIGFQY
jgi:hypothetical protein